MLSQDCSTSRQLASLEQSVCKWLEYYSLQCRVTSLHQLTDGRVFARILEQLPGFELVRPIFEQSDTTLHERIRNIKIVQESLRKYLQVRLAKDAAGLAVVSISELCSGSRRQTVKFLQVVLAVVLASQGKQLFLERIRSLSVECQEMFVGLIKNALAMIPEQDMPPVSSPSRARTLLERIDELELQIQDDQQQLTALKKHVAELEETNGLQRQEIASLRTDNASLVEELSQLKNLTSTDTDRDSTARLKNSALQLKLDSQRNAYERRIQQLESELIDAESRIDELRNIGKENRELQKNCQSANKRLVHLEETMNLNLTILQEKDTTITALRDKHRQDRERIIDLEREVEQMQERSISMLNPRHQSRTFDESHQQPSTYRERRALGNEMSEVVQQMAAEQSRLMCELTQEHLQKERDYEGIILKQREKIKFLEELLTHQNSIDKENDPTTMNTTGKKTASKQMGDVVRVGRSLQENHRQEIAVLIDVIGWLKHDNEELRQQTADALRLRSARQQQYRERLDAMFT